MSNISFDTELKQHKADTLSQQVYLAVRDAIVEGRFKPGERLTRRQLVSWLGVSQNPVTEALMRLEMDGFVESRPLYGCRVRTLSFEDIENEAAIREAIEIQLARACATTATESDFKILAVKAAHVDRVIKDNDPKSASDIRSHMDFHLAIGRATGKYTNLLQELERAWMRSQMRMHWIEVSQIEELPPNWHARLVDALRSGSADKADAAMREHMSKAVEFNPEFLKIIV